MSSSEQVANNSDVPLVEKQKDRNVYFPSFKTGISRSPLSGRNKEICDQTALFHPLTAAKFLPELHFGNVYINHVENPSPHTAARM